MTEQITQKCVVEIKNVSFYYLVFFGIRPRVF